MSPEEGADQFRYKEDEETPLYVLLSGSRGVTVTEDNIYTLRCEGILVGYDNDTSPEIVLQSEDVLPAPETLNFGFKGIDPW